MTKIANVTGYSRSWVAKTIKRLQEQNIIKHIGSNKNGYKEHQNNILRTKEAESYASQLCTYLHTLHEKTLTTAAGIVCSCPNFQPSCSFIMSLFVPNVNPARRGLQAAPSLNS